MFDWFVNTPPTPAKKKTVKQVSISWKCAQKKIVTLTLGDKRTSLKIVCV